MNLILVKDEVEALSSALSNLFASRSHFLFLSLSLSLSLFLSLSPPLFLSLSLFLFSFCLHEILLLAFLSSVPSLF
jgi:hypothetical protein